MSQANLTNMHKFPSVSSIHSMVSLGYLPPGHGYIPKKQKPDKPYGPSYIAIMNRTWRGPGRKYLRYAFVCFCLSLFLYVAAALYFAHRNVSRVITRHSEPTGACLLIVAISLTAFMFHLIHKARIESNRWRSLIRFEADGLFHVVPTNDDYQPRDPTKLQTGTYGPRAVKEIPKPRHMKGRSRPGSRPGGRQKNPAMTTLMEDDESPLVGDEMGSQEFLDHVDMPAPPYNGSQGGPQNFNDEPMLQVHKPMAQRLNESGDQFPPQMEKMPLERMPPQARMPHEARFMQQERMPPQVRRTPDPRIVPIERMPPQARMTPEPRTPAGMRQTPDPKLTEVRYTPEPRPPAGVRQTPEPRPAAGVRQTPEPRLPPTQERMPAGMRQTPEPRLAPTPSRAPAGAFKTPEPRMVPGQGKPPSQPRMVPGQGRPPAGSGRATPRGVTLHGVPNQGMSESDL